MGSPSLLRVDGALPVCGWNRGFPEPSYTADSSFSRLIFSSFANFSKLYFLSRSSNLIPLTIYSETLLILGLKL